MASLKKLGIGVVAVGAVAVAAWAVIGTRNSGPEVPSAAPTLRLMTQSQYINTIGHIFGPEIAVKVRFAPLERIDGLLTVGSGKASMTTGALDPLYMSARGVAEQIVSPAQRNLLIPCQPADAKQADEACARQFLGKVGRLLYRRPLTTAELDHVIADAGKAVGPKVDFYAGLSYALAGMLSSPQFLYVKETVDQNGERLDAYSKASRLSFLLWDAAPDNELLAAAESGDLHKPSGVKRQVDRMIASPRFKEGVRAFFSDMLLLENFGTLAKDPEIYPAFTLKAVEEAREQILRTIVDHLVTQHADYRDLFTSRRTFVSSDLAALYRIPVNLGSQGWVPYETKQDDPRLGLLSQVGFLAQFSHAGRSSPTQRGRAIREVFLCQKVPDPPGDVDFSKFEDPTSEVPTARERLIVHSANPTCAGCHAITDPIGLGLENFDGAGQYRTSEKGTTIDPSGVLDGVAFKDAAGLGQALRDNPALKSCLVNRYYAYSKGRKVMTEERPLLTYYETMLDQKGYRFDEMVRAMALDNSFFSVTPAATTAASSEQR